MLEILKNLDTKLFLFLNHFHSPFWDEVMWQISGKILWIPLYLGILTFIIYKYRKNSWLPLLGICLVILFCDQVASGIIKPLVERLRPSHDPSLQSMVHTVHGYLGGKYGMASSHASNTFGLAIFTSLLFKIRWYTTSILIWAIIVSFSRIYLGVHFLGDVIVGMIIGCVGAFFVYWIYKTLSMKLFNKA